jgi:hypothetical protein
MKRTLVVLALAVAATAGCRAVGPYGGSGCGDYCAEPCEPCHVTRHHYAPRPDGAYVGYGRGGTIEDACPPGGECLFARYRGHDCGPGYHPGPYDCSPCHSPHWGLTGYRHPHGYRDGRGCFCDAHGRPLPHHAYAHHHQPPGAGYMGAPIGPGHPNSGDHIYNFHPGPPVAQTAYPYYTLRGPRDFLLANPPPLGPF